MSIHALTWVMDKADTRNHGELAVLYALAERAHDDGRYAWPAQSWIAYRSRCTDRTVRRHLKALEERGVIRRGDQRVVAHLDSRYRPIVWDIDMTKCREDVEQRRISRPEDLSALDSRPDNPGSSGRTIRASRPDNPGSSGRTQVSYKPSYEPSSEPSYEPTPCSPPAGDESETAPSAEVALRDEKPAAKPKRRNEYPEAFEKFWALYPKTKNGTKKAAFPKWKSACKKIAADDLLEALRQREPELTSRDIQWRPQASRWLNEERWTTEITDPLPGMPQRSSGLEWADMLKAMDSPEEQETTGDWLDAEIIEIEEGGDDF